MIEKPDDIKKYVRVLFEFQDSQESDWKECDKLLSSQDKEFRQFVSIDMNKFKPASLDFAPNIDRSGQPCKLIKAPTFFMEEAY